jgi:iron uptake system component EfeO
VIGMHGIERILYSNQIPQSVRHFESGLPGYAPARFPATADEAARFKHRLAQRLVSDIRELEAQFAPLELDLAFAFEGLVDLVNEQLEKTDKAASGEEESRYAQTTLRDLRSNQQGVREVYALFRPWLESRAGGSDQHGRVQAAFQRMSLAMEPHVGDGMPAPPEAWSSIRPKAEHRETPFGQLFFFIKEECDEARAGSLHHELRKTAELLGLPSRS